MDQMFFVGFVMGLFEVTVWSRLCLFVISILIILDDKLITDSEEHQEHPHQTKIILMVILQAISQSGKF